MGKLWFQQQHCVLSRYYPRSRRLSFNSTEVHCPSYPIQVYEHLLFLNIQPVVIWQWRRNFSQPWPLTPSGIRPIYLPHNWCFIWWRLPFSMHASKEELPAFGVRNIRRNDLRVRSKFLYPVFRRTTFPCTWIKFGQCLNRLFRT